jgi:uncharacterized protein with HEPN domain
MATRSPAASLTDIVEAIEHVQGVLRDLQLAAFKADWKARWVVERGVEIISEASRRLPDEMKAPRGNTLVQGCWHRQCATP